MEIVQAWKPDCSDDEDQVTPQGVFEIGLENWEFDFLQKTSFRHGPLLQRDALHICWKGNVSETSQNHFLDYLWTN